MNFIQNKSKRAVIVTMAALSVIVLIAAYFYYDDKNNMNDSRVVEARKLYEKYNEYIQINDLVSVFPLMDSIENIYKQFPHYENSFELGVLHNNKAAAYIIIGMYKDTVEAYYVMEPYSRYSTDSLFDLAKGELSQSISLYSNWIERFDSLPSDKIEEEIKEVFLLGLDSISKEDYKKVLKKRVEEIEEAQKETYRRISVSYTNLGIVYRHQGLYEDAVKCYKQALDYWEGNLSAENNLNILLGQPLKKRSVLKRLFPEAR